MKNTLYNWVWKWHYRAGLICLPIVVLLSITGSVYLFKDNYEQSEITAYKTVEEESDRLTFQEQLAIVQKHWDKAPTAMVLPSKSNEATEFTSGRFSHKSSVFVSPYSGEITGQIIQQDTDMYKVRKLHGELLMGSFGTKIIELVASWLIVLLITGIYLFWPRGTGLKGFFKIRFKESKRIFYRDVHSVLGFWFSWVILLILIGGLPWTDVFGGNYRWVQNQTDAGFSTEWKGFLFKSKKVGNSLILDDFVAKARDLYLDGTVSIALPKSKQGVYSISNSTVNFSEMHMCHFDQYSGELLYQGNWEDIGLMMKTRLWVMAFHQGQFGLWNFILVLITSIVLALISITGILSYLKRKRKVVRKRIYPSFQLNKVLLLIVVMLGILLPMFGLSVLLIFVIEQIKRKKLSKN